MILHKKNKKALLVFLDLAKTFYIVDRNIVLNKMEMLGTRRIGLNWLNSCIKDGKQSVSVVEIDNEEQNSLW